MPTTKKKRTSEPPKSNSQILFSKGADLSRREQRRKKKLIAQIIGFSLVAIEVVIAIVFVCMLFFLNMIPNKYMIMLIVILALISAYNLMSQFTRAHWLGKALAVILSVAMVFGSLYVGKANGVIGSATGVTTKTDSISLIVLKEDAAASLADTAKYTFGYNSKNSADLMNKAIDSINKNVGTNVTTRTYDNSTAVVNALYNKDAQIIIFNESARSTLEEQFPDFHERTRILETLNFETQIKTAPTVNKDTSTDTFTIYISGNDDYGSITATGRSDVNIIATFNPKTKQVLLVSTPRDYWVEVDSTTGQKGYEKLTHAGNYGVDSSITTLQNLYGIDIDYYVKVNFTGAVGVIDALDGITINSEVDFTNGQDAAPVSYHFTVGDNECDGAKALAFCRERQAFSDGDNQRGRNQMQAIKGMIAKATSPKILTNYNSVMDAVSGLIATSMPSDAISGLIKSQLSDGGSWNVLSYSVSGTGASRTGELFGLQGMSVVIPDNTTVNNAIEMMGKIRSGQVFDVTQFLEDKALQTPTTAR